MKEKVKGLEKINSFSYAVIKDINSIASGNGRVLARGSEKYNGSNI